MNQVEKGAIAENYVAYELSKRGHNSFRIGAVGEIDVITTGGIRVEVKSSSGTKENGKGIRYYSFTFSPTQTVETPWEGRKSDYCICLGFDNEYSKVLFSLCIPTHLVMGLSNSSPERTDEGFCSLGVGYRNGVINIEDDDPYINYLNNWDIVR